MYTEQNRVGIQAVGLGGSFHEIAARDYFGMGIETELVPYISHNALMGAFHKKHIDQVVIAVDNTVSGRVQTAVDALSGLPRSVHIVGSRVVPVEQRLLLPPGTCESDITAVLSQRPALDQCSRYIAQRAIKSLECDDTLQAAELVSRFDGRIEGYTVGAIASKLAGITTGLTVGMVINDRSDNATKFWRISRETNWDKSGTHAAVTFDLPSNSPGSLLRALQVISGEHGYDLTDIDSHLYPRTVGKRSFYTELLRPEMKNPKKLITALKANNISARLLGIYDSEELVAPADYGSIPAALKRDSWSSRNGLQLERGTNVLHVEATNEPKALLRMLKCLSGVNIEDLSRPTIPHGDQFSRGFYIVIDSRSSMHVIHNAVDKLQESGFQASLLTH